MNVDPAIVNAKERIPGSLIGRLSWYVRSQICQPIFNFARIVIVNGPLCLERSLSVLARGISTKRSLSVPHHVDENASQNGKG